LRGAFFFGVVIVVVLLVLVLMGRDGQLDVKGKHSSTGGYFVTGQLEYSMYA